MYTNGVSRLIQPNQGAPQAPPPDFTTAWERVGRTMEARGRWLVGFADRELDGLSTGDWLNLRWEVLAFTIPDGPWGFRIEPPPPAAVRRWRRWVRSGLAQLAQGDRWQIDLGRRRRALSYTSEVVESARVWHAETFEGELRGVFAEEVERTLSALGRRFRLCRHCRRPFVARRRQAYCTPRCSQIVRTERYQKAHQPRRRRRD